jgi:hypothetical protein
MMKRKIALGKERVLKSVFILLPLLFGASSIRMARRSFRMLSIIREAVNPDREMHAQAQYLRNRLFPIVPCGITISACQHLSLGSARLLVLDNVPKTKVKVSVRKYTAAASFYQKR